MNRKIGSIAAVLLAASNGLETCQNGVCSPGTSPNCNDANPCTVDTCDPTLGCQHGPCDDGNPLTVDVCSPVSGCEHDVMIAGNKLSLKNGTAAIKMKLVSKNTITLSAPPTDGTGGDPVLRGGSLRLVGGGASPWSATYALPSSNWTYAAKPSMNRGYRYVDLLGEHGPIRTVVVRDNSASGARGALPKLAMSLSTNPDPVGVVLTLGTTRYCMSFGGTPSFVPDLRFGAKDASPPTACP